MKFFMPTILILLLLFLIPSGFCETEWDILSESEKVILDHILTHWETWVPAKKADGTAPMISFEELYAGLAPKEKDFLDRVREIDPKKSFNFQGDFLGPGQSNEEIKFRRIENQIITKDGKEQVFDPQYLPEAVYAAYEKMMTAMEKDLGKRLLVESGYRSHAYQLYTFLFYTPKHQYALKETGRWVALPGYSEHGAPDRQAIDFINQAGINGEDNPEEFENLPEYAWLTEHAYEFGFELSYPRAKQGITFEPWHWRCTHHIFPGANP